MTWTLVSFKVTGQLAGGVAFFYCGGLPHSLLELCQLCSSTFTTGFQVTMKLMHDEMVVFATASVAAAVAVVSGGSISILIIGDGGGVEVVISTCGIVVV